MFVTAIDLRRARPDELAVLVVIDDAASAMYAQAGLTMDFAADHPFVVHERARWQGALTAGDVWLAVDTAGTPLGFAAVDRVDGLPHLDQLSVVPAAGRRGLGRRLLDSVIDWAEAARAPLWLTTYAHLPWNRPFYESAGFAVVPEGAYGPEMTALLAEQRRYLPDPDERVAMRRPPESLRRAGRPTTQRTNER